MISLISSPPCGMANSILRCYKIVGLISSRIHSRAIVSQQIGRGSFKQVKKRGPYRHYSAEERASIGKYAIDHGVNEAESVSIQSSIE